MVLLLAVAAGFLSGLLRSWLNKTPFSLPALTGLWWVPAAVFPQLLIFHLPFTANWFSTSWARLVLVGSLLTLLVFVSLNWMYTGVRIFGIGLVLNLIVILLNGGLMPLAPQTAAALFPEAPPEIWQVGSRPGRSKNILLPSSEAVLPWLGDTLLLPAWFPWTRALSPGDLLIALGVFWLLSIEHSPLDDNQSTTDPSAGVQDSENKPE